MNVIRDIDIKDLKEVFKRQIDLAVKKELTNVRINYVTALRILDVLEETQIREERHQTLESACTFIEMEDGTQTSDKVPGCYGNYYDEGLYCNDCKSKESCIEETVNREDVEENDDFI